MNRLKTTNPIQQLTLMALLSALHVIFLMLQEWYAGIGFILTITLPILTVLVWLNGGWRSTLLYGISSILLMVVFLTTPLESFIFVATPHLLLGLGYAWAYRYQLTLPHVLWLLSLVQWGILMIIRWFSRALYQFDIIDIIYQLLQLQDEPTMSMFTPLVLYLIALIQLLIQFLLIMPMFQRIGIRFAPSTRRSLADKMVYLSVSIMTITLSVLLPSIALWMLGPTLYLMTFVYTEIFFTESPSSRMILIIGIVLFPFFNAILSDYFSGGFRILSILVLTIPPMLVWAWKSFTQRRKNALI